MIIAMIAIGVALGGCGKGFTVGETYQTLKGNEENLPDELKGLRVYSVNTSTSGGFVKVAILDDKINSVTSPHGKIQVTTIIIDKSGSKNRTIICDEIISETEDVVVVRKKK